MNTSALYILKTGAIRNQLTEKLVKILQPNNRRNVSLRFVGTIQYWRSLSHNTVAVGPIKTYISATMDSYIFRPPLLRLTVLPAEVSLLIEKYTPLELISDLSNLIVVRFILWSSQTFVTYSIGVALCDGARKRPNTSVSLSIGSKRSRNAVIINQSINRYWMHG